MIDLKGKHLFIAGGSRGIGAAAALMAARAGAAVSINYLRGTEAAEKIVAEIRAAGGQAVAVQGDIAVDGAMDRAIDSAVQQLGALTGLVVSAGIFEGMPLLEMTAEFWDRTMGINVRGTFLAVRAAVRHLRASGNGGSIIIYTSTAGQRGSDVFSAYATPKARRSCSCAPWPKSWPPTASA
jgi:3-oxoacyl-[acyl-carrier protein] reductase